MFGNSERDLCATLSTMESVSRERTNFNTVEAKSVFRDWIRNDARFGNSIPMFWRRGFRSAKAAELRSIYLTRGYEDSRHDR
jgi:hypothetical protein